MQSLYIASMSDCNAADVVRIIHPYHYRTIYQANFDLRVPVKKIPVDGVSVLEEQNGNR